MSQMRKRLFASTAKCKKCDLKFESDIVSRGWVESGDLMCEACQKTHCFICEKELDEESDETPHGMVCLECIGSGKYYRLVNQF